MRSRQPLLWLTIAIVAATPATLLAQSGRYDLNDRIRDHVDRAMQQLDRQLDRSLRQRDFQIDRSMRLRDRDIERTVEQATRNAVRVAERASVRARSRVVTRDNYYFDHAAFDARMDRMHERINRATERARTRYRRW